MFEGVGQDGVAGPGTVVGANVKLTGTISDVNDITIHGTVEGEIISDKTIVIAETATVKGPITAQVVSVSGRVNGSITAHQKLELLPTGQINGSIATKDLNIKSGASFNGKCTMTDQLESAIQAQATAANQDKEKPKTESTTKTQKPAVEQPAPATPIIKEEVRQPETVPATPTFELED